MAETSFIGGANLFVEGLADQVLLAGVSSHLRALGAPKTDTLDLNSVTIVPAGSSSSIPYLIYLARGRDVVRPPCVALLDSDSAGDEAVKTLARGGPRRKEVLPAQFVLQVGEWAQTRQLSIAENVKVTELEDLISLPLAAAAARNYAAKVIELPREDAEPFSADDVAARLTTEPGSLFDAVRTAFSERLGAELHIEKVGFAKEVVAALATSRAAAEADESVRATERNFGALLGDLARLMRAATRQEQERRLNNRLKRAIAGFLSDYPSPTTRERGRLLIEEVQAALDDSEEGDRLRVKTERLRRDFELDENLTNPIDRFDDFRERVRALEYEERFAKQSQLAGDTTLDVPRGADADAAGTSRTDK